MARRILIANHKGGSGKSVTAVNLAAALAEAGITVDVGDIDPQANSSRRLGCAFDPANPTPTMSEVVKSGEEGVAADAVVSCGWGGIYSERIRVIPSRFDLENRISEAGVIGATSRLRRAMEGVDDDRDVTLLDCQPSLGHLFQLAVAAADDVLIVTDPEFDGVEAAVRVRDFLANHAAELGRPDMRIIGVVVSRYRAGIGAHEFQVSGLPDLFGADLVWEPYVPERAAIKDAADGAMPLRALGTSGGRDMAKIFDRLAERTAKAVGL